MSEFMGGDFWLQLADKLVSYGTGRYNVRKIKRLSMRAIKANFYSLDHLLRRVLIQRYHKKKTLAEIGRELNMTPQGVYHHEKRALDNILTSALRIPRTFPLRCKSPEDKTSEEKTPEEKTPENKKPLIDEPCRDRRRIRNVLTELSPRIISRLEEGGYNTIKQLCWATPNDLKNIYGIGNVAFQKIRQAIKAYRRNNPRFFPPFK